MPFTDGKPVGYYEISKRGFWASGDQRAEVWGRPAALAIAKDGSLLVADDTGGTIWKVRTGEAQAGRPAAAPTGRRLHRQAVSARHWDRPSPTARVGRSRPRRPDHLGVIALFPAIEDLSLSKCGRSILSQSVKGDNGCPWERVGIQESVFWHMMGSEKR